MAVLSKATIGGALSGFGKKPLEKWPEADLVKVMHEQLDYLCHEDLAGRATSADRRRLARAMKALLEPFEEADYRIAHRAAAA